MLSTIIAIAAIVFGIIAIVKANSSWEDYWVPIGAVLIIFGIIFGLSMGLTAPALAKYYDPPVYTSIKVVPVNVYYLYQGRYTCIDNSRGTDGNATLEVKDLDKNAVVYETTKVVVCHASLWHYDMGSTRETYITFKKE